MHELDESDNEDFLRKTLAIASIFRRPTTLEEFRALVEVPAAWARDVESLAEWIQLCGSFLSLREGTIYFVHQSAKDFLLKTLADLTLSHGIVDLHHSIFSQSLKIMSRTLRRDLYDLKAPGFPIDEVQQPSIDPLAAMLYSCIYWVDHFVVWLQSEYVQQTAGLEKGGLVTKFIEQKFLYWLEALSLCGGISAGVRCIMTLEQTMKVPCYMHAQSFR